MISIVQNTLFFDAPSTVVYNLIVYNFAGNIVFRKRVKTNGGRTMILIGEKLAKGAYLISLSGKTFSTQSRVTVE